MHDKKLTRKQKYPDEEIILVWREITKNIINMTQEDADPLRCHNPEAIYHEALDEVEKCYERKEITWLQNPKRIKEWLQARRREYESRTPENNYGEYILDFAHIPVEHGIVHYELDYRRSFEEE